MTNKIEKEIISISPEMASIYLQKCARENRVINRNRVLFYAKQMKEGQWQLNGETIIFSENNTLLNGYHRMSAVIEAGVPVEFLVIKGVSEDSFKTIDTGKMRSAGDVYKMSNILNATRIAAIVRKYKMLADGRVTATNDNNNHNSTMMQLSNTDMLELYYKASEEFQEFGNYATCLRTKFNFYPVSEIGGIMCYLHLSCGYDKSMIYDFFNELYQYDIEDEHQEFKPCRLLRERLFQNALNNQKLTAKYKQKLLAKVWNCWKEKKDLSVLKVIDGEDIRFE